MNKQVKRAIPAALALALALAFPHAVSAANSYTFNAFSPTTATDIYDWTDSKPIISVTGSARTRSGGSVQSTSPTRPLATRSLGRSPRESRPWDRQQQTGHPDASQDSQR